MKTKMFTFSSMVLLPIFICAVSVIISCSGNTSRRKKQMMDKKSKGFRIKIVESVAHNWELREGGCNR